MLFTDTPNPLVIASLSALAADRDDTRACGAQRFQIPIAVLAYDPEAIVVQERCKLLWESIAQRGASNLGVFFLAFVPAFEACQMQDLRDVIIDLGCRHAHFVPIRVVKGWPVFFLGVRFKREEEARSRFGVGEQRVACLKGEQSLVLEVCAHALQQCLLFRVGYKSLKCIAGEKDQAKVLLKVKGASVTFHPTNR